MKKYDTKNLVITMKERYMSLDEARLIRASILANDNEKYTEIQQIGKNKYCLKLVNSKIDEDIHKQIKKYLNNIGAEIYLENAKHKRRRKRQLQKENIEQHERAINGDEKATEIIAEIRDKVTAKVEG